MDRKPAKDFRIGDHIVIKNRPCKVIAVKKYH